MGSTLMRPLFGRYLGAKKRTSELANAIINCRLDINAKGPKFCKDAVVPVVVRRRRSARRSITAPENGDSVRLHGATAS
jgi:hypothetical protein